MGCYEERREELEKFFVDDARPFLPFVHPSPPPTTVTITRRVLVGCLLFIPRILALLGIMMFVGATGWLLVALQHLLDFIREPTRRPHRSPSHLSKPLRKIAIFSIGFASRCCLLVMGFWRIKMIGEREHQVTTIVSNHVSYLDTLIYCSCFSASFIARAGVKKLTLIGLMAQMNKSLFVDHFRDRSILRNGSTDRDSGARLIVERQTRAQNELDLPPLVVFPEATTTNGLYLARFHTGAFVSGLPVQPVCLRYRFRYFSPSWESIPFGSHFARLLSQVYNEVEVIQLPAYYPSEEEKGNPVLYAENVQKLMARTLSIPATTYGTENKLAYHREILAGNRSWKYWLPASPTTASPTTTKLSSSHSPTTTTTTNNKKDE